MKKNTKQERALTSHTDRENQKLGYLMKDTAGTNGRDAFQKTQTNGQDLVSQKRRYNGHKRA